MIRASFRNSEIARCIKSAKVSAVRHNENVYVVEVETGDGAVFLTVGPHYIDRHAFEVTVHCCVTPDGGVEGPPVNRLARE